MASDRNGMRRRAFLGIVGAGTLGTAGCTEYLPGGGNPGPSGTETGTSSTDTPTGTGDGGNGNQSQQSPGTHEPMRKVVAGFEDLSFWTAHANVTLSGDTQNAFRGSQSARVEGSSGSIQFDFPVATDFSNRDMSLAFKVGEPTNTVVSIAFIDTGGNRTRFVQTYYGTKYPNEWMRLNPSVDTVDANMQNIKSILISITGPGQGKKYWVDDFRFNNKAVDKGQVVFTFDYLRPSIYETAFPIMQEYDLQGCVAVPVDRVGNSERLSLDQLKELDSAGWELASMTNGFAPMHDQDRDIQQRRLQRAKDLFQNWGFDDPRTLIYPRSALNPDTLALVQEMHDIAYLKYDNSMVGHSQSWLANPWFVNRARPNSPSALENQLQVVRDYTSVFTIWHDDIGDEAQNSEAEFREMCRIVAEQQNQGNIGVSLPADLAP